ncbi:MAG: hypothetical protein PVI23_06095 [Maricaulaceae bacterium]|jgi:hypothetical protein
MRYMARMFWTGVTTAGAVDYLELSRYALSRLYMLAGGIFILVGLVVLPLPIPLGLPMIVVGAAILINTSTTAKKIFVRMGRRYPRTVGRVRNLMSARRRNRQD